MLIQFSVTSFLSFKGEVILSLSTNKDDSHNENLLSYKNERILPSIAIAGKSNLHKAMSAVIRMIRSSNNLQIDQSLMVTPFLLDEFTFNKRKYRHHYCRLD